MKRIAMVSVMLLASSLLAFAGGSKEAAPASSSAQPASGQAMTSSQIGGSVSVLGPWGGNEQTIFDNMVKPFEQKTGVKVEYVGTRDGAAIIRTRVAAGNPPDIYDFPNPGALQSYANQGKLVDLSSFLDMNQLKQQYAQGWLDIGTVNGKLVGVFVKAALKGIVWYDPQALKAAGLAVPTTWDQMMQESQQLASKGITPWAVSLESGAASGWPGCDWIDLIFLKKYGPELYTKWYEGKVPWTSPQVKDAFETWGKIVAAKGMSYGGRQYILSTNFGSAFTPLWENPPKAYFFQQATFMQSFIQKQYPNLKPGVDLSFFDFPGITPQYAKSVMISGDLMGAFNNTPQADAFMKYITTPEAQAYWVKGNDGISPNREVPISDYPDVLSQTAAKIVTSAEIAVFGADDQMPPKMEQAFFSAAVDYVSNPANLDSILTHLDNVQKTAY